MSANILATAMPFAAFSRHPMWPNNTAKPSKDDSISATCLDLLNQFIRIAGTAVLGCSLKTLPRCERGRIKATAHGFIVHGFIVHGF
ncbi:hypothetical protein [Maritalea sp.]|uniref:hypothetical protein n=1 Tax=Maritalea sp. TaxID=2003361 RepID=UPI003EF9BD90